MYALFFQYYLEIIPCWCFLDLIFLSQLRSKITMVDQQQPQPQQEEMNAVHASGHELPPGFRFYPSDNEIVSHYLMNKVRNTDFTCTAIGEVDVNKIEPWDLPSM